MRIGFTLTKPQQKEQYFSDKMAWGSHGNLKGLRLGFVVVTKWDRENKYSGHRFTLEDQAKKATDNSTSKHD